MGLRNFIHYNLLFIEKAGYKFATYFILKKKIKKIIHSQSPKVAINKKKIYKYWGDFNLNIDVDWHNAYISANNVYSEKYIDEILFYNKIEPKLNDFRYVIPFQDKNNATNIIKNIKHPEFIFKNIGGDFYDNNNKCTREGIKEKLLEYSGQLIIKPSVDSGGGKGVKLFEIRSSKIIFENNNITFSELVGEYGEDYLVQKLIIQNKELETIYPHSLNTVRVLTWRNDGEIEILSSVVRFGNDGFFIDNQAAGGISAGLDEFGYLKGFAVDKKGRKYYEHPFTKVKFKGKRIPNYSEICSELKDTHSKIPYFDLISWDIAVDKKDDPIFIEMNLRHQEINFHQFNNGPLFGEFTDKLLSKVGK